jgi:hypothetical protein
MLIILTVANSVGWSIVNIGSLTLLSECCMSMNGSDIVGVLDELKNKGLLVKAHNAMNKTWYIKGDGIFVGYVATSDELIELKRENRLDLSGIKSLG